MLKPPRGRTIFRQLLGFRTLWVGQVISAFGSAITTLALPLTAVVAPQASPAQMGVLGAFYYLPHLLLGLATGVWVDCLPRRPILIVADLGQALLLGSLPVVALLGALRMECLYAVALRTGGLALFFGVAATAYVPALVGRERLSAANSASALSASVATVAGPALAGGVVQLVTAPVALALDALSFALAAPPPPPARRGLIAELGEGVRLVVGDPVLRAMVGTAGLGNLTRAGQQAVLVLYLVRELGLAPAVLGVVFAANGVASIAGALLAGPAQGRLGPGPALVAGTLAWTPAALLLSLAGGPHAVAVPVLLAVQALLGLGMMVVRVNPLTARQLLVPDQLLGRVNATRRVVVFGAVPVGSLLGGLLGQTIGLRGALVVGALGMLLALLWLARSPARTLRPAPGPECVR